MVHLPSLQFFPFQRHLYVDNALLVSRVDAPDHAASYEEATLPTQKRGMIAVGCAMDLTQHSHQKYSLCSVGLAYGFLLLREAHLSDFGRRLWEEKPVTYPNLL